MSYQSTKKGSMNPDYYIGDWCFYRGDDIDVDEEEMGGKIPRNVNVMKKSDVYG